MSKFASTTTVPAEKSRMEIERTLQKYGATGFAYATEDLNASIGFKCHNRIVRFHLPLPKLEDYKKTPTSRKRNQVEMNKAKDQAVRQRWRCLALAVKAKLEVVESGISTFEDEFLSHIVTYDGRTVGEVVKPRLEESYKKGIGIPLLGPVGGVEKRGID